MPDSRIGRSAVRERADRTPGRGQRRRPNRGGPPAHVSKSGASAALRQLLYRPLVAVGVDEEHE
ncbi:MAG: hypothetical protein ACLP01_28715, partial [Solirubrobacteraceae bacterium]